MSIQWTSFTNIFCRIPYHWRNTKHTFLSCWIQKASLWANTYISFIIINHSLSTSYTLSVSFIPIVGWITSNTSAVSQHKWWLNWTKTLIFSLTVYLTVGTSYTFWNVCIPMSSWRTIITIFSIPDWGLNWTYCTNTAIPERVLICTIDTFLTHEIVISFLFASFTLHWSKIPVSWHVTFYTFFSIIKRIFRRAYTNFSYFVEIRVRFLMTF